MIILDKPCKDIFANYWLSHYPNGIELKEQFLSKEISRSEYLNRVYSNVDKLIVALSVDEVKDILCRQNTYDFNLNKIINKLNDRKVVYLTEPFLIKHVDSYGNTHFLLDACPKEEDFIYKRLRLNPATLSDLISFIENHNYYMRGVNWSHASEFSLTAFVFGENLEEVEYFKIALENNHA
jgi:hypothetical protein